MTTTKLLVAAALLLSCGGKPASTTPESSPAPAQADPAPGSDKGARKVVTETKVEILEKITFSEGATLAETSGPIIEQIAKTLEGNRDIQLVAVEAHAADEELAMSRGQAVIDALLNHGVAAERLTNQSISAKDEIVEFIILKRETETEDAESSPEE